MGAGKVIAGLAALVVAAEGVASVAGNASSKLLRPPGIQSEQDFMARCIKCGKCIEACPYAALHAAGITEGAAAGEIVSKRAEIKRLLKDLKRDNPDVEKSVFNAIHAVSLDTFPGWKTRGEEHSFLEWYDER